MSNAHVQKKHTYLYKLTLLGGSQLKKTPCKYRICIVCCCLVILLFWFLWWQSTGPWSFFLFQSPPFSQLYFSQSLASLTQTQQLWFTWRWTSHKIQSTHGNCVSGCADDVHWEPNGCPCSWGKWTSQKNCPQSAQPGGEKIFTKEYEQWWYGPDCEGKVKCKCKITLPIKEHCHSICI